jgi:hypothetical protein
MVTGYEVEMYNNIGLIARNLNRIANCLEANEKREREREERVQKAVGLTSPTCAVLDCQEPVIVTINDASYCQLHVDQGFIRAREVVSRAIHTQLGMELANLSIQDRVELRKQEAQGGDS